MGQVVKTKTTMNTLELNPRLKRWTRPSCYMGAEWPDYYSAGVGQHRDSGALERANFDAMLKLLGGEQVMELEDQTDPSRLLFTVQVVRESHWAVGWVERVEYIRKHRSQFSFHDWQDLLSCVRGKYFAGYASELLD